MKNFKKVASLVLVLLVVFLNRPTISVGAGVFNESFGAGSSLNDIPNWDEEGSDSDSSTLSLVAGSGNDSVSPNGGRFAKIARGEWICTTVNTTGYGTLTLGYQWRGDSDADDNSDDGIVEYKTSGNCTDSSGWSQLQNEDLKNDSSWSTRSAFALSNTLNNSSFLLRFRTSTDDSDEYFRVDAVSVEGALIPDMCPNIVGLQITVPEDKYVDQQGNCVPIPATISATKIVCDSEAILPNWGDGSPSTNITSSTATNFVAAHPNNCRLQSDWNFEWAPSNATNPGNQVGVAGGAWTPFGPTNGSGVATTTISPGESVWVREQANSSYIPFSGDTSSSGGWVDVSAEMYCGTDASNYDNYDRISSPNGSGTYHCVAFNVQKPDVCLNIPELQTEVPDGYHTINTNDQIQCVPDLVDVQLCKTNDADVPQPLSGWTVKLDSEGSNDYQGITGENGCYIFKGIPYGNYTASEVMQEGWTQVSLPNQDGTIQAYNLTNGPYNIVNHYNAPICDPQVNLIQNGGFEAPALAPSSWAIIPDTDSLLKWLVSWVATQATGTLGLEIQNNVAGLPAEGSQHAELDGDHPVSIWQDIPTIPGKVYNLNFKYSARPGRDANDNMIEAKVNGITLGSVLSDDGTSLTDTSWGSQSRSFIATGATTKLEFVDTGTDTSFGGYLDDVSLRCDPNPKATISAKKIVCDNESDLPNWGVGGADINANTATDFLAQHESCHLEPWTFEWAPNGTSNPGDNAGVAGGAWTPFTTTAQIPAGNLAWVREQMQGGYVPFSGATTDLDNETSKNSAELYCNTDVLNYDNYDWIDPVEPLQTYYCVAFNAKAPETCPEGQHYNNDHQCVPDEVQCVDTSMDVVSDNTNMTGDGNAFGPLSFIHSAWTAIIDGAMWIWDGDGVADSTVDTTKVFTKSFTITGVASDSSIDIASDNSYTVKINDVVICSDETEGDTDGNSYANADNCVVPANVLSTGTNTLSITVRNWAVPESNPESNPAGLKYKLHINSKDCPESPTTGSIEIKKYLCPADFVPNRNDNGVKSQTPENCVPQNGVAFGYVYGTQTNAEGPYPELDMSLTSGGLTVAGVLTIPNLTATGRYLVKEIDGANLLGLYCEGDGDTNPSNNDNQELTFVPAGGVAHCVAYNKAPAQVVDVCLNVNGVQLEGPCADVMCTESGGAWNEESQICVMPQTPTDVCPNIPDNQAVVPSGMQLVNNQCVNVNRGGHPPLIVPSNNNGGQVLGASTQCGLYLDDYLKMGKKNNKDEVKKLQTFLNDYLKLDPKIPVNGNFGLQTHKAVLKFQEQESDYILKPWVGITLKNAKKGTGWVFKTTVTRINNIMCPELNLSNPPLTI